MEEKEYIKINCPLCDSEHVYVEDDLFKCPDCDWANAYCEICKGQGCDDCRGIGD